MIKLACGAKLTTTCALKKAAVLLAGSDGQAVPVERNRKLGWVVESAAGAKPGQQGRRPGHIRTIMTHFLLCWKQVIDSPTMPCLLVEIADWLVWPLGEQRHGACAHNHHARCTGTKRGMRKNCLTGIRALKSSLHCILSSSTRGAGSTWCNVSLRQNRLHAQHH